MLKKSFIILPFIVVLSSPALANSVAQSQRMLNQLGYNAGPIDGAYGKKTRSALEIFYSENGSLYDGKLDANEVVDLTAAMDAAGLDTYQVSKVNEFNGKHFAPEFKLKGKYALPLKSMTSEGFGATGPDKHEWRYRLNSFMHNFYAVGDFTGDGIQDFVVTAFRAEEVVDSGDGESVVVSSDRVSKKRSFKVFSGDDRTGWANDYYRSGGEDITDRFIEDPKMAGIADSQLSNQLPIVADFNGDGIDDLYIASAIHSKGSRNSGGGAFFGGWHSYYLSQPDGTFVESSREMVKGKFVERSTGRYTEFSHRSDAGDLDGDGDIDLVHTSVTWNGSNGYLICMYNDGTGRMTSKKCGEQRGHNVKIGDFNGDGNADLVVLTPDYACERQHNPSKMKSSDRKRFTSRVIFGDGSGRFSNRNSTVFNKNFEGYGKQQMHNGDDVMLCSVPSANVADVDNDGDLDIIGNTIGHLYVGGYFQIFLNDGAGNFSLGQQIIGKQPNMHYSLKKGNFPTHESRHSSQGYCFNMHTVDFNDDGFIDFMCDGGFFQPVDGRVLVNNGDGTFKDAPKWLINKHVSAF
jgi:hypothetical protein